MPSRYVIRSYSEDSIYHVFNRGVEKRIIFTSAKDYLIFLYYLQVYLLKPSSLEVIFSNLPVRLMKKNLSLELELLSYCLMPNHFHLLLKTKAKNAIPKFMKQITNAYCEYFNKTYKREGALMQGRYKAVMIENDDLLVHLSRYIHLNPVIANIAKDARSYRWSSIGEYLNNTPGICTKKLILEHFSSELKYEKFINDHKGYSKKLSKIKHTIIES